MVSLAVISVPCLINAPPFECAPFLILFMQRRLANSNGKDNGHTLPPRVRYVFQPPINRYRARSRGCTLFAKRKMNGGDIRYTFLG